MSVLIAARTGHRASEAQSTISTPSEALSLCGFFFARALAREADRPSHWSGEAANLQPPEAANLRTFQ
jgi:hypothetical protein